MTYSVAATRHQRRLDYSGIITQAKDASGKATKHSEDQYKWGKKAAAGDKKVTDRVVKSALDRTAANDRAAASDRARYEKTYVPLEDKQAQDALSYNTPERRALEMGKAQATVAQEFRGSAHGGAAEP